jgi:hypothetical protein
VTSDADEIIEDGPIESDQSEDDYGDSRDSQTKPQQNNFQAIPPGNENLPSAEQSGPGLINTCMQSGFSREKCNYRYFQMTQADIVQH